ncbi:hypothetical protein [Pseudomonas donghuensis]|uniref:hypothetical protein n=1 Tax=Pseudomonas donghuensis TaxID=1163398 RepID=UPI00215EC85E|nr:hypothetical protein [Pseudomonas donghuensis]UVL26766.1 hypothetical protein LOY30_12560 [Pseudomonas donghuensis]
MPTENRSSNTEQMVSMPMSTLEKCLRDANLVRFTCDKHVLLLQDLLSQPAAQHQGEPMGWTYEDGKEYTACPDHAHDLRAEGIELTPVYRHPPTSNGFSAGDMADQGAKAFAARDPEVKALRSALQFYADRDHFSEDMGGDWDNVSGEPANILWHESEAWFVEDGSIARAALSGSAVPPVEYGPTPGCKQCEEAEACGLTDCPECDAQLSEDVNGNGVRPDA